MPTMITVHDEIRALQHEAAQAIATAVGRGEGARAISEVRAKAAQNMDAGLAFAKAVNEYVGAADLFILIPLAEIELDLAERQFILELVRRIPDLNARLMTAVGNEIRMNNPLLKKDTDQTLQMQTDKMNVVISKIGEKLVGEYTCDSRTALTNIIQNKPRRPRSPQYESELRKVVAERVQRDAEDVEAWGDGLAASVAGLSD
jgi:hypothetical protein